RLGRRGVHPLLPALCLRACGAAGLLARRPEPTCPGGHSGEHEPDERCGDQEQRAETVAEDRDPDQDLEEDVDADAAAAAAASAIPAASEAARAATGCREGCGREDQRGRDDDERRDDRDAATARRHTPTATVSLASGPLPGSSWAMCWSAW